MQDFPKSERGDAWVDEYKFALAELDRRKINGVTLGVSPENFLVGSNGSSAEYEQKITLNVPGESSPEHSVFLVKAFQNSGKKTLEISAELDPKLYNRDLYKVILKHLSDKLPEYILHLPVIHSNTRETLLTYMKKYMTENPENWKVKLEPAFMKFASRGFDGTGYVVCEIQIICDPYLGVLPQVICKSFKSQLPKEKPKLTIQSSINLDDVTDTLDLVKALREV